MAKDKNDQQTTELFPLWKVNFECVTQSFQLRNQAIVISATDINAARVEAEKALNTMGHVRTKIRKISEYV